MIKPKKFDRVVYRGQTRKGSYDGEGIIMGVSRSQDLSCYRVFCLKNSIITPIDRVYKEWITAVESYTLSELLKGGKIRSFCNFGDLQTMEQRVQKINDWLKGERTKEILVKNRKGGLLSGYFCGSKHWIIDKVEFNVEKVRITIRELDGNWKTKLCSGRKNYWGFNFKDFDPEKIYSLTKEELFTASNTIGRMYAKNPFLEWIPRLEEKYSLIKVRFRENSKSLQKQLGAVENHLDLVPNGTPIRVRKMIIEEVDKILEVSDLLSEIDSIIKKFDYIFEEIVRRVQERILLEAEGG